MTKQRAIEGKPAPLLERFSNFKDPVFWRYQEVCGKGV